MTLNLFGFVVTIERKLVFSYLKNESSNEDIPAVKIEDSNTERIITKKLDMIISPYSSGKVAAIKALRSLVFTLSGGMMGLRDSKEFVERHGW